jgi:hypothetical protein
MQSVTRNRNWSEQRGARSPEAKLPCGRFPTLYLNIMHRNKNIVNISNTKSIGLTLDNIFSWEVYIGTVVTKLSSDCCLVRLIKPFLFQESGILLFSLDYDLCMD